MNYKSPDNTELSGFRLHEIDPEFERLLPDGYVQITQEEADEIRLANQPVVDEKEFTIAKITMLEQQQIMPRATREFIINSMESSLDAKQLKENIGYQNLKAIDNEIKELRGKL